MVAEVIEVAGLGLRVTPMTAAETAEWVVGGEGKRLLLNHNLHSAFLYQKEPEFRDFYAGAERVLIDGAPILWLAQRNARDGLGSSYRIGSTDWIDRLGDAAQAGRLMLYGASESSNQAAVSRLRHSLVGKGWQVEGMNGYVARDEAIAWLRRERPSVVIVGLGMPLQEEFLRGAWDELPDATYATVGGAIDYIAGSNALAPRWMGRLGIEWLWRLAHDPRRLAHRYLVEPFKLAWALITKERQRSERARVPTSRELTMPNEEIMPSGQSQTTDSEKM